MSAARILVVEDESIVANDIRTRLASLGYEVSGTAATGEEAIQKAHELRPDLVLMDLMLKGDLDGVDASWEILKFLNVPVVYLTAYADSNSLARAKITRPFGYILKPYQTRELNVTIEMALFRHRMERRMLEIEHWLLTTLESIADAVIATDPSGIVRSINPAAQQLTGLSEREVFGRAISDLNLWNDETTGERLDPLALLRANPGGTALAITAVLLAGERSVPVEINCSWIADQAEKIGIVIIFRDISARRAAEERMQRLAFLDQLTGLPNRALVYERIEHALANPDAARAMVAFLFVDLDNFKQVNDTLGHLAGDQLLQSVAERLRETVRGEDTVGRFAGDEFVIILNAGYEGGARRVAEKILNALRRPFELEGAAVTVTSSVGIALYPRDGRDIESLVRCADRAMYSAKQMGKNGLAFYNEGESG